MTSFLCGFVEREPGCASAAIVIGCQITDKSGHSIPRTQSGKDCFQKARLPSPRTGNQADHQYSCLLESSVQCSRQHIVVFEHLLPNFNQTSWGGHSISIAVTSNSRPAITSEVKVPHSAQQSCWKEITDRVRPQVGMNQQGNRLNDEFRIRKRRTFAGDSEGSATDILNDTR